MENKEKDTTKGISLLGSLTIIALIISALVGVILLIEKLLF